MRHLWLLLVPFVMILGVSFIPQINGPHLWFGLPSLLVWILAWTLAITPVLVLYERLSQRAGQ
ncbi:MAG TPA: hypothetical protein VE152_13925 [Acidimicrobiales bacterium]|nr:hypothetical protein [Acidimicrobiales bacterium]